MASYAAFSPDTFAEIPPSILGTLPALQPPAGVKPNFVNPEDKSYIQISVATVLFCLMVLLFANRVYTKLVIIRKSSWDDCECAPRLEEQIGTKLKIRQRLMYYWICRCSMLWGNLSQRWQCYSSVRSWSTSPLSGVMHCTILRSCMTLLWFCVNSYVIRSSRKTSMGCQASRYLERQLYYSEFPNLCFEAYFDTKQTSSIIVMFMPFALLFTKLTFFLLYFQVFRPLRWLRISAYLGAVLTCAFYGAATIAQIVFEVPKHGETWLEYALSGKSNKGTTLSIPLAAVGLGIDIVLLVMPIAAVVGLQLPKKRKMGIIFIFMFGIL